MLLTQQLAATLAVAALLSPAAVSTRMLWQQVEELRVAGEAQAAAACADGSCGEPLDLSALIAAGKHAEARAAAKITALPGFREPGYSAILTAPSCGGGRSAGGCAANRLFFWYLPPQSPAASAGPAPTIMWLQGGPGAPSTYGMFTEIGPVVVGPAGTTPEPRNHSWNAKYGLLIVDNPPGVGFSSLVMPDDHALPHRSILSSGRVTAEWPLLGVGAGRQDSAGRRRDCRRGRPAGPAHPVLPGLP